MITTPKTVVQQSVVDHSMKTTISITFIVSTCLTCMFSLTHAQESSASKGPVFIADCESLAHVVGIEKLSKYRRLSGSYQINENSKIWKTVKYQQSDILIPVSEHQEAVPFNEPFDGTKYIDKENQVTVSVFAMDTTIRRNLSQLTRPELYRKYGGRPLFSYMEDTLGVYVDGFCESGNAEKAIAMFMSSIVVPLDRKVNVYQISEPRAILTVGAVPKPTQIKLIFPANDSDTVNYVFVGGPTRFINKIIETLTRQ